MTNIWNKLHNNKYFQSDNLEILLVVNETMAIILILHYIYTYMVSEMSFNTSTYEKNNYVIELQREELVPNWL